MNEYLNNKASKKRDKKKKKKKNKDRRDLYLKIKRVDDHHPKTLRVISPKWKAYKTSVLLHGQSKCTWRNLKWSRTTDTPPPPPPQKKRREENDDDENKFLLTN